mgnify:CR=1 FL=1
MASKTVHSSLERIRFESGAPGPPEARPLEAAAMCSLLVGDALYLGNTAGRIQRWRSSPTLAPDTWLTPPITRGAYTGAVSDLVPAPGGGLLSLHDAPCELVVWDAKDRIRYRIDLRDRIPRDNPARAVHLSPDGRYVLVQAEHKLLLVPLR